MKILIAILVVLSGLTAIPTVAVEPVIPEFDPDQPKTWEKLIASEKKQIEKRMDELAEKLIEIAGNPEAPGEKRRQAILALGRLSNEKSRNFLITNIALFIPKKFITGDLDRVLEHPCIYALRLNQAGPGLSLNAIACMDKIAQTPDLNKEEAFALLRALHGLLGQRHLWPVLEIRRETAFNNERRENIERFMGLVGYQRKPQNSNK